MRTLQRARDGGGVPSRPRIVVVEDDPQVADLLRAILEGSFELSFVRVGTAAVEAVERARPDLVLLDIHIPLVNGFEICQALRARRQLDIVPVLFMTSRSDPWSLAKCREVGGDDVIHKPFKPADLSEKIERLLRLRRR